MAHSNAYVDWTADLRREARELVAQSRASRGLPPWDWKDPTPTALNLELIMNNGTESKRCIEKECRCGCGQTLMTWLPKPNHDYIRGHKPASEVVTSKRQQGLTRQQTEPLVWQGIDDKLEQQLKFTQAEGDTAQAELVKVRHNLTVLEEAAAALQHAVEKSLRRAEAIKLMIATAKELA